MLSQVLIFSTLVFLVGVDGEEKHCEPISHEICSSLGYNETIFPNLRYHENQEEAVFELNQFKLLIMSNCSLHLKYFLCSVYFPMCSEYNRPFPPCRHLCEEVRRGCEGVVNRVGVDWPVHLECEKFPLKSEVQLCFGPNRAPVGPQNSTCSNDLELTCPRHMKVPEDLHQDFSFMGAEDCGAPCNESQILFWNRDELRFGRAWVGSWSLLCCFSTLFTVLTYAIDMKRLHYPERPIVYLSGCYLMISIAYISGFFLGETVACREFQSSQIVTQGTHNAGCTILFMIVYFFGMASSIWWVILTVTWFLAAGLKWGNEAIAQKSSQFHTLAWTVPSIQTIIALVSLRVEGDVLSGVCSVGVYSTQHQLWALLVPLTIYTVVGTCFLIAGFVAMFNIRSVVKNESGVNKVEKLEKLMVRIGVFSVLYTVPATVTIACYIYEHSNKQMWLRGWLIRNCRSYGVTCPCRSDSDDVNNKPNFIIFIVKYFMLMIVGITSGFWVWSSKTVESWSKLKRRLFCVEQKQTNTNRYQHGAIHNQSERDNLCINKDVTNKQAV